jgi:rubrerythrin
MRGGDDRALPGALSSGKVPPAAMNEVETAMRMELESEQCYRRLADENAHTALAAVFNLLADGDVKHYEWLRRKAGGEREEPEEESIREELGWVFRRMLADGVVVPDDAALVLRYRMAQELEDRSVAYYARMAAQAESEPMKEFYRRLVAEDILHKQVLESVIQFVSEPVHDGWLDKAQWLRRDPD